MLDLKTYVNDNFIARRPVRRPLFYLHLTDPPTPHIRLKLTMLYFVLSCSICTTQTPNSPHQVNMISIILCIVLFYLCCTDLPTPHIRLIRTLFYCVLHCSMCTNSPHKVNMNSNILCIVLFFLYQHST